MRRRSNGPPGGETDTNVTPPHLNRLKRKNKLTDRERETHFYNLIDLLVTKVSVF